MNLDSFEFILFLLVVFAIYWCIPSKAVSVKNAFLILASYVFYAFADWRFLFLLFGVSLTTYLSSFYLDKLKTLRQKKILTAFNIVLGLAVLCVFKYLDFFVEEFCKLLSTGQLLGEVGGFTKKIILPVGVSFYVFMAISYSIDRYRGGVQHCSNPVDFFAYISFFPHLLSGPIDRGRDLIPQLQARKPFEYDLAVDGLRQILYGCFKKVVIANNAGILVDSVWASYQEQNSVILILAAVMYSIQIYADFSGYSDMAIGTGKLFGIRMRQNFSYPYFARNVSEFWRSWHMSLTSWFTEYLYIPLGGNRKGKLRTLINTMIVFTLCGLWHGANWTFILWGFVNGLLFIPLIFNAAFKAKWKSHPVRLDVPNIANIIITFVCITLTWILFRAPSVEDAFNYFYTIATNVSSGTMGISANISNSPLFFLFVCILIFVEWAGRKSEHPMKQVIKLPAIVRYVTYLILVFAVFYYTASSATFIYQDF